MKWAISDLFYLDCTKECIDHRCATVAPDCLPVHHLTSPWTNKYFWGRSLIFYGDCAVRTRSIAVVPSLSSLWLHRKRYKFPALSSFLPPPLLLLKYCMQESPFDVVQCLPHPFGISKSHKKMSESNLLRRNIFLCLGSTNLRHTRIQQGTTKFFFFFFPPHPPVRSSGLRINCVRVIAE